MVTISKRAALTRVGEALSRNPACRPPAGGPRLAATGAPEGALLELVALVSCEPMGSVYGHVFHGSDAKRWWTLLVFSRQALLHGDDATGIAAYRRAVVDEGQFEPLFSNMEGETSATCSAPAAAVDALVSMIAGYTDRVLATRSDDRSAALDMAPWTAYAVPAGIRRRLTAPRV